MRSVASCVVIRHALHMLSFLMTEAWLKAMAIRTRTRRSLRVMGLGPVM